MKQNAIPLAFFVANAGLPFAGGSCSGTEHMRSRCGRAPEPGFRGIRGGPFRAGLNELIISCDRETQSEGVLASCDLPTSGRVS